MPIDARHQGYSRMLAQLECAEPYRSWLRDIKGLPDEAIDHFGFRSFELETLVQGLSNDLPGVDNERAKRLKPFWNKETSEPEGTLLIPMFDIQGRNLGFQVVARSRCIAELSGQVWEGNDKYKCFTTKAGQTRLPAPYDAQPLGYFCPPHASDTLTLYCIEGGVKGAVVSWRLEVPVLWTAGAANFPECQLLETIRQGGFQRVVLMPDAGMLENKGIARAYFKLSKSLKSHGIELLVAYWDQAEDKSAGDADELILAGQADRIRIISYDEYWLLHTEEMRHSMAAEKSKSRNYLIKRTTTVEKPLFPDVEARRVELESTFHRILSGDADTQNKVHAFVDPTGIGKTFQLVKVLKQLAPTHFLAGRILVLTRTKELAASLIEQLDGFGFYMPGRNEENCRQVVQYQDHAKERHNAGKDVCWPCQQDYKAANLTCPYIQKREQAREAPIIVAVYGSYINEGSNLDDFSCVVIDESLIDAGIVEEILFTKDDLQQIQDRVKGIWKYYYPADRHIHACLDALQQLFERFGQLERFQIEPANLLFEPLYPHGLDVLLSEENEKTSEPDTFRFERQADNEGNRPTRVFLDLLQALLDGQQRAILTSDGIRFSRTVKSLELLKGKTVINLDATPNIPLLEAIFGGGRIQLHGDVLPAPHCHITQVFGWVHTQDALKKSKAQREELLAMVIYFAKDLERPLFIGPKFLFEAPYCWQETLTGHFPGMHYTWFGGDTRGSNKFQDCDGVVIIGHHQPPIDGIRLKVNALRDTASEPWLESDVRLQRASVVGNSELIPARLQPVNPGPLVQHAIEHSALSEIVQAIGRTRPLSKWLAGAPPVPVIVLDGWVHPSLLVDVPLTREAALQAMHPDVPPVKRGQNLTHLNQARADDARCRYNEYVAQHPQASQRQISEETGLSRATVSKYQKEDVAQVSEWHTRSDYIDTVASSVPVEPLEVDQPGPITQLTFIEGYEDDDDWRYTEPLQPVHD
jgi:hypothetical protein